MHVTTYIKQKNNPTKTNILALKKIFIDYNYEHDFGNEVEIIFKEHPNRSKTYGLINSYTQKIVLEPIFTSLSQSDFYETWLAQYKGMFYLFNNSGEILIKSSRPIYCISKNLEIFETSNQDLGLFYSRRGEFLGSYELADKEQKEKLLKQITANKKKKENLYKNADDLLIEATPNIKSYAIYHSDCDNNFRYAIEFNDYQEYSDYLELLMSLEEEKITSTRK